MKSLINFKKGEKVNIIIIKGSGQIFRRRLYDLGIFDGTEVEILKNDQFGPIVLKIFQSKIALGRGQAEKIYGEKI